MHLKYETRYSWVIDKPVFVDVSLISLCNPRISIWRRFYYYFWPMISGRNKLTLIVSLTSSLMKISVVRLYYDLHYLFLPSNNSFNSNRPSLIVNLIADPRIYSLSNKKIKIRRRLFVLMFVSEFGHHLQGHHKILVGVWSPLKRTIVVD